MKINNMRFNYSKLNTPVQFYTVGVSDDGMPTKPKPELFYECWAHVESVTLRDYQTAVQTGTQHQVKLFIRDYADLNNKMQVSVNDTMHKIKSIISNYRNSNFTIIVAEAVD